MNPSDFQRILLDRNEHIAKIEAALRGLIARVERVGGYATTEDQLALRQAKQALSDR